jgi:hypothetical protein
LSVIVSNPSPKKRFQESTDNVKRHRDLIQMREFERAADFAMLHYMAQLGQETDGNLNAAAAAHLRLTGAREFLWHFRNLAESTEFIPRRAETPNLDHSA